tara:strand:- start:1431 stop:1928 length:498 start_codon:yes stop_codon:yes gene_type:complete
MSKTTQNSTWYLENIVATKSAAELEAWNNRAISSRIAFSKTGKPYVSGQASMLARVWSEALTAKQAQDYGFANRDGSTNTWTFRNAMSRCLRNQFGQETGKQGSERAKRGSLTRLEADALIEARKAPPVKYLKAIVEYRVEKARKEQVASDARVAATKGGAKMRS